VQKRLIDPSDLKVGEPLPCDAYDAKGKLLLRRGQVITSASQIEKLKRHALWAGSAPSHEPAAAEPDRKPSPLSIILAVRRQLHLLSAAPVGDDVSKPLMQMAAMVQRACKANADVALASILMHREGSYAIRHSVNAAIACQIAGAAMSFSAADLSTVVVAALTMNFGMLDLQQRLQEVGPLSDEQRRDVSGHCERGVAWLQQRGVDNEHWLEIVRDHHERPDGSGYPARKAGDAIHPTTQLVSLADIYCARVSSRACRSAMLPNVALRRLFLNEGAAVNEHHAASFIKTLGIYPPGTGVRLHNGSIAVVTRRGATDRNPRVSSITTHDGLRTDVPIRRHGDPTAHAVTEVVDLDELEMTVSMEALWGADATV
jgi:HD-GYP domain-containing protein (c-di-GMP phosphodiesterase class II)